MCLDRTDERSCDEVLLAHSGSLLGSQGQQAFSKETEALRLVLACFFSSNWFVSYFQTWMPLLLGTIACMVDTLMIDTLTKLW